VIAYFLMLAVPSTLAILAPKSKSFVLFGLVFAIYFVMIGFRFSVGMDWNNYANIHRQLVNDDFASIAQGVELGANLLFWVSSNYFDGQITTNIVAGLVFTIALLMFAERQSEPWLAIVAATPFLCIVTAMSAVRQSLAIAVILLMLAGWRQSNLWRKSAMTLAAALFHLSALAIGPIIIASLKTGLIQRIVLAVVVGGGAGALVFYGEDVSARLDYYSEAYIVAGAVVSQGAIAHIALVAIPAVLYLLFKRTIECHAIVDPMITWSAWIALSLFAVTFISSVAAGRLSLYFHFLPMVVFPLFIAAAPAGMQMLTRIAVIGWHGLYLWIWLTFSNSGFAWIPYENVLFGAQ
jgi:hypothetical protein